jgi:hypothetical protein
MGSVMGNAGGVNSSSGQPVGGYTPARRDAHAAAWAFVYIFFTNGIPFDSPNRSEPCPPR